MNCVYIYTCTLVFHCLLIILWWNFKQHCRSELKENYPYPNILLSKEELCPLPQDLVTLWCICIYLHISCDFKLFLFTEMIYSLSCVKLFQNFDMKSLTFNNLRSSIWKMFVQICIYERFYTKTKIVKNPTSDQPVCICILNVMFKNNFFNYVIYYVYK